MILYSYDDRFWKFDAQVELILESSSCTVAAFVFAGQLGAESGALCSEGSLAVVGTAPRMPNCKHQRVTMITETSSF